MLKFQFFAIIRRREFRFPFIFMMALASGYPVWLVSNSYFDRADIGSVCDPRYAFIFLQYNDIFDFIPFIVPILTLFPVTLSYITDCKTRYESVYISRCGVKKFLFSAAALTLILGFAVVFVPSLWNIFLNRMLLPETFCSYNLGDYYNDIIEVSQNNISKYELLWFIHPLISDIYSAFRMALLVSVLSLVTFVSSTFIRPKYGFTAVVPAFILLYGGTVIQDFVSDVSDYVYVDLLLYTGSCSSVSGMGLFYVIISLLAAVSFVMLYIRSKKDMI